MFKRNKVSTHFFVRFFRSIASFCALFFISEALSRLRDFLVRGKSLQISFIHNSNTSSGKIGLKLFFEIFFCCRFFFLHLSAGWLFYSASYFFSIFGFSICRNGWYVFHRFFLFSFDTQLLAFFAVIYLKFVSIFITQPVIS